MRWKQKPEYRDSWHIKFLWWPVLMQNGTMVWMEYIYRRGKWGYDGWEWEYQV